MPLRLFPCGLLLLLWTACPAPDAGSLALGQGSASWQQRVAYEMDVTLHADRHQMAGTQRLVYENHSPDTLRQVFYHLYFNAFQPHSMMAERNRVLPDPDGRIVPRIFNLGPDEVGYHEIEELTQNGRPVEFTINDTVMRVDLAEPIAPGDSAVFEMAFESQVPLQTRRSGRDSREGIDYSMSQWYPKVAAYDERGWHADPYVGREFYAPFGTFDVRITLPADYVVGATGVLQNPGEVEHGYEAAADGSPSSDGVELYARRDSLTWHFVAENVHDFAWAADPDYVHDTMTDERGITYHFLYQPDVAEGWAIMPRLVPTLIQFYSERYGPYPYPQFTVAQAGDGGMEYPMINFITGGRTPNSLIGVTAHEAAHEWFYGVLGSNESDYSWMDEGFTSYATTEAQAFLSGLPGASHLGAMLSVLALQEQGLFERINTPADWFETNGAFGVASYSGGEMVVDLLGYVISDSLLSAFFHEYYRRFQFRHPNPEDVEKVAEDVSGLRLDWFFEQFLNTTRALDYAITDVDSEPDGAAWQTSVTLRREDEAVMPVDVRLVLANGLTQWVNVPLGIMEGHKPVPEGWIVAEPWDWTSSTYTFQAQTSARVIRAEIDPRGQMPDRNRLNNRVPFPFQSSFLQPPGLNLFAYSVGWRPLAQYAYDFGVGAGVQARGEYLFDRHRIQATLKLWPQVLLSGGEGPDVFYVPERGNVSFFDGIDYEARYTRKLRRVGPFATLALSAEKHLGLLENRVGFETPIGLNPILARTDRRLRADLIHQLNPTDRVFGAGAFFSTNELGEPGEVLRVNPFDREHMLSVLLRYRQTRGADHLEVGLEVGSSIRGEEDDPFFRPSERGSANRFYVDAVKTFPAGPLRGRAQFRYGWGAGHLAAHKLFRLGAASFEDRWRDDAFRAVAAPFRNPIHEAHLAAFDGPGPVAYLLAGTDLRDGFRHGLAPSGNHLIAGSLALSTGPLSGNPWLRPLRLEAFSGIGDAWFGDESVFARLADIDLRADVGLGLRYNVGELAPLARWTEQSDVLSGLHLVAKVPFWVSDPESIEFDADALAFRWLIGVEVGR